MANPVVHFEITAKACERLHDIYTEVFGSTIDADNALQYELTCIGLIQGRVRPRPIAVTMASSGAA